MVCGTWQENAQLCDALISEEEYQNQNNLYSTHVVAVAVQTKYYCTVLNMEIVYENMKIVHCMTYIYIYMT